MREKEKMLDMEVAREAIRIKNEMQEYNRENPRYTSNRFYCEHGTYVGSWAGPDYMCGYCEDGVSMYKYALGIARENQESRQKAAARTVANEMIEKIPEFDGYKDLSEEALKDLWVFLGRWCAKHT